MKTIADEWASYEAEVLPATAGEIQRTETRRGFYAGAQALLSLMVSECSDVSDEEGADVMEALHRELRTFAAVEVAADAARAAKSETA